MRLGDVSEAFGGYAFKSQDFRDNGIYQVLRIGNIRPGIIRSWESPIFMNPPEEMLEKSKLEVGDIVITLTGTKRKRDYGFTAEIKEPNYLLNQRLAAIRFSYKNLSRFFLYCSWTDSFKDQFFEYETGNVGQGNVGMKGVTTVLIPLCSAEEQHQIVQEIESRLSECDNMESTIAASMQQAEALRQSILKKAFEGRLLNDKELEAVRQDPAWEPAERLLERIRAEKPALQLKKPGRKGKYKVLA